MNEYLSCSFKNDQADFMLEKTHHGTSEIPVSCCLFFISVIGFQWKFTSTWIGPNDYVAYCTTSAEMAWCGSRCTG